jgi:hypothetical protein
MGLDRATSGLGGRVVSDCKLADPSDGDAGEVDEQTRDRWLGSV